MTEFLGVEQQYVLAAVVAFSGVFALGVIFSILGSVKLKLAAELKIDDAKVGTLISALMFSSLVAVLLIGPLQDMVGYKWIALVGFLLGGACVWLLASAISYQSALIACLLLGIAAMCVNTVGNTLGASVLFGGADAPKASNFLNVFFGLGAFLTPFILANLLAFLGYKKTVGLIGTILFLPLLFAVFAKFPEPGEGFNIAQSISLLGNSAVIVGSLSLFCYIALEASMAGFVTTYLKSHNFSDEKAGTILSGFWISLMLARLITALFLIGRIDSAMLVPLLGLLAVVSIGIMVVATSPGLGVLGTLLTGLALGPVFPTIVGVTFNKSNAIATGTAGSVFGLIFGIGLFGGIIVPMLIGKYAAAMSIRQSLKIALVVAVALVVASGVLWLAIPDLSAAAAEPEVTRIETPTPMFRPVGRTTTTEAPAGVEVEEAVEVLQEEAAAAEEAAIEVVETTVGAAVETAENVAEAVAETLENLEEAAEDAAADEQATEEPEM